MKLVRASVLLLVGAGMLSVGAGAACAATTAGVIIESPRGVQEFCVSLEADEAPALDVLAATGARLVVQDLGADAITICRIDDVGCDHPGQPCFCSCTEVDQDCRFWGIYTVERDRWEFSQLGIGEMRLRAGDILGLRWAVQSPDGGAAPTVADPDGVCARAVPVSLQRPTERGSSRGLFGVAAVGVAVVLAGVLARARRRGMA